MPVIRSARKKLKVDRKRESANKKVRAFIDFVIKKAQRKPTLESIRKAFSAIDKGVKKDILHKNKAARLKSNLSKLTKTTATKSKATKKTKKAKK